jgi:hypothetical protein
MYIQNQKIGKPGITFIRYTQNQKIGKPGITFIRYTQNQDWNNLYQVYSKSRLE